MCRLEGCGRGGVWEVRWGVGEVGCGGSGVWERCRWEVRWGVGGWGVGEV